MKGVKFLLAVFLFAIAVGIGTSAIAEDGLNDSHGVWRNSEYWHANHPEWAAIDALFDYGRPQRVQLADVEEPVLVFAKVLSNEVDGFDVRDLVDVHDQAA